MTSAADLLRSAGARPSFKFKDPTTDMNVAKGGVIESVEVQQATEFGTGKPLFDDSQRPVMELVVACIDDDGERAAFYATGQMLGAIKAAVLSETGGYDIAPGGRLMGTWTGTKPSKTPGFNDQKLYTFTYAKPGPKATSLNGLNPADLA